MNKFIKSSSIVIIFLLFTTYIPNQKNEYKSFFFPLKKIDLENNFIIKSKIIKNKLNYLYGKNIMFIDNKLIENSLKEFDFISSFQIKKIYPNKIKIILIEKEPLAIYIDGKKKFYITKNNDIIKYKELDLYNNLPTVFGKKINFKIFFTDLQKINFPMIEIKSLHYFQIDRWDLVFKDDRVLKLPNKDYMQILKNFNVIKNDHNFKKYKIFDYRIKDQLILN